MSALNTLRNNLTSDVGSFDKVGDLASTHFIPCKATLGFLPAWLRGMVKVGSQRDWMDKFNDKYHLEKKLTASTLPPFLETLTQRLQYETGEETSDGLSENISCKFSQVSLDKSESKSNFRDTVMCVSSLVKTINGQVVVVSADGSEETAGEFLMNRFPIGNTHMTMRELCDSYCPWSQLPTNTVMQDFIVPEEMQDRPAVQLCLPFHLRDKPKPTGAAARKTIEMLQFGLGHNFPIP